MSCYTGISTKYYHNLALLKNGKVNAWGNNNFGEIEFPTGIANNVLKLSAGGNHSIALLKDGTVTGWGDNKYGQLDVPSSIQSNVTGISAGVYHNLALLKDGNITGWGAGKINNYPYSYLNVGQLVFPPGLSGNIAQIEAGYDFSVVLLKNGKITGWGGPGYIALSADTTATGISAGPFNVFALLTNGIVTGTKVPGGLDPNPEILQTTGISKISRGFYHSVYLLKDGRVTGHTLSGPGYEAEYGKLIKFPTGKAVDIAAGYYHSLALLEDGTVTGWGINIPEFNQASSPSCSKLNQSIVYRDFSRIGDNQPFQGFAKSSAGLPFTYYFDNNNVLAQSGNFLVPKPYFVSTGSSSSNYVNITIVQSGNVDYEPISITKTARIFQTSGLYRANTILSGSFEDTFDFGERRNLNATSFAVGNTSAGYPKGYVLNYDGNTAVTWANNIGTIDSSAPYYLYFYDKEIGSQKWKLNSKIPTTTYPSHMDLNGKGDIFAYSYPSFGNSGLLIYKKTGNVWNLKQGLSTIDSSIYNSVNKSTGLFGPIAINYSGDLIFSANNVGTGFYINVFSGDGENWSLFKKLGGTIFSEFGINVTAYQNYNIVQLQTDKHGDVLLANLAINYSNLKTTVYKSGKYNDWNTTQYIPTGNMANGTFSYAGLARLTKDSKDIIAYAEKTRVYAFQPQYTETAYTGISILKNKNGTWALDNIISFKNLPISSTGFGNNATLSQQIFSNEYASILGVIDTAVGSNSQLGFTSGAIHFFTGDSQKSSWKFKESNINPANLQDFTYSAAYPLGYSNLQFDASGDNLLINVLETYPQGKTIPILKNALNSITPLGRINRDTTSYVSYPKIYALNIFNPNQSITFPPISDKNYADKLFYLSGFSNSNLPLTYSSSNSSIASIISGNGVKINNVGSVTITANQAGNFDFEPAIPVSRSFNVFCDYVKEISLGTRNSLALLKDGRVTGWGGNDYGVTTIPVDIGTGAAQISAGTYHSLALLKDGRVTGWGRNFEGQTTIPVDIGTNGLAVSAAMFHSLALLKDGRVTGWGNNASGQLNVPSIIQGNVTGISTSYYNSFAVLKDGRVTGWGLNYLNLLNIPTDITGADTISAGDGNVGVLLKNGGVTGWWLTGQNITPINIPTSIGTGATQVVSAGSDIYVLLKDGRITGYGPGWEFANYVYGQSEIIKQIGNNAIRISTPAGLVILKDGRVTKLYNIISYINNYGQFDVPNNINCLPLNPTTIISAPNSTYILSGQNLSNAPLIGIANVPGTFNWTNPFFVPPNLGSYSYDAIFVPNDFNYTTVDTQASVDVFGIPNIITKPTGTPIKYAQTLVNSNLTDGVADIAGTFTWTNPQTIANNNTGINNYPVTFTPSVPYYLNALTDANVNVTKADQIINFPNITNKIIKSSFVLNATSNIGLTINYSTNDTGLISFNYNTNDTIVILNSPGTATITANASGNQFYDAAPSVSRTFNITQLPFISENIFNLRMIDNSVKNDLNFNIELSGSSLISKSFDVGNNEPFYIGLEKDRSYPINVKSQEKLFEFGNKSGTKVVSSPSYTNVANLNIDFSQNEPQLDISTEVSDFLSLVYKLDDIITPSGGIQSVNRNQLKAFTIDYKTYISGEVLSIQQVPYMSYKKYELNNYCPPQQIVTQVPLLTPCTIDFACGVCSSALKIKSENPSQTFIDIPKLTMPYKIYGNLVDYIFADTDLNFYRITLNDKLFDLCCQCKKIDCAAVISGSISGKYYTDIKVCKQDNLFDRPKSVNENFLNQKYGLYFFDAITFKSIGDNYGPYSYYSGEIKNTNSFSEGAKITFKQYSYNFDQAYADIYLSEPIYKPVDTEFIYSSTITGNKYFYTTSELVDKINLIYNSTGIYTWLPMLYSEKPYYSYGPMLFAELKDESTIGLISLKSGRLGEHDIRLISSKIPNTIINSYLVPKTIELQGSNDGLIWNKIISSEDIQPVNVLSTSFNRMGGNTNYDAIENTKVTRNVIVPTSSEIGSRTVPSGKEQTSGTLSNLIDQIESGNKQFATGNGATILCVPTAGRISNICGSGYKELWIPSKTCPGEKGLPEEDDAGGGDNKDGGLGKTISIEENAFRIGYTDYR
jgi:alpha-tubulin suppressor-like RCC1 family protein